MSSRPELKLDWCSYEAAKYAVEHWHYSRVVPHDKLVRIGVWEGVDFAGVVLFANGANNNLGRPYGLRDVDVCELVRIALRAHASPVSRIVRVALRMLRQRCPGIRLVVSYADPEHGHVGAIYQAGNWVYAGRTAPADEYVVRGRRMHGKALRQTRSTHHLRDVPSANVLDWTRKVIDPAAYRVDGSSKYRYLYPLDDEVRRRIAPLAKPYPKRPRPGSVDSDAPANPAGEGGAKPTSGLRSDHAQAAD